MKTVNILLIAGAGVAGYFLYKKYGNNLKSKLLFSPPSTAATNTNPVNGIIYQNPLPMLNEQALNNPMLPVLPEGVYCKGAGCPGYIPNNPMLPVLPEGVYCKGAGCPGYIPNNFSVPGASGGNIDNSDSISLGKLPYVAFAGAGSY